MNDEIRRKIFSLGDEKYKEFHNSLCPDTDNIIGVRVPLLRNYAKDIVKLDFRQYLNNAQNEYYEEIMLQGMVIGIAKMELQERLEYLEKFIPKIDNWAVCDTTCAGLKFVNKNKKEVWNFLQVYLNSEKEFEVRFAIVMMLNYYLIDEYIDEVLVKINYIKQDGYYVKMALAWLISIAYIKFPNKTMEYLRNNKLDDFTFNKALQKMLESYRVSKEQKEVIKNMKRKK